MTTECDLLIIGAGPAGLSAAINGASEGLKVCLIDNGSQLGGQARESNAIENYPGFPCGVTGDDLMSRFVTQAVRFNTVIHAPLSAARIIVYGNRRVVVTEDYQEFTAKAVILSLGLNYRRLQAQNIGRLMGKGVYYGLPSFVTCSGCAVGVVGGANSAAQAALHLAKSASKVYMFVRSKIELSMSTYLVERINKCEKIVLLEGTQVTGTLGSDHLTAVNTMTGANQGRYDLEHLFIYIGALPRTMWIANEIELDSKKFIRTGSSVTQFDRRPFDKGGMVNKVIMPFETNIPGVFAAGDVRSDSTKRIAAAIGEGSAALAMVHQYMKQMEA